MKPDRINPPVLNRLLVFAALCAAPSFAGAEVVLNDWCFNLGGDTSSACNPLSAALPANVNASAFDFTLNSPGTNNQLGSVTIRLGAGNGQFVAAYMDYDLNVAASGSFQDVGSVHGIAPPGVSFELGDPSGSIFGDFAANGLTNVNGVAVGSRPPGPCCDVAWALGVGGINVAPGSAELLTFLVTTKQPTSGFYLQQTNIQDGESIYFTENVSISAVPLPSSILLLGSALGGLLLVGRRRAAARDRAAA